jgi:deoxyhypusine synthase
MAPTYIGDFALRGRELRLKGQNRIGNLIVPNGVSFLTDHGEEAKMCRMVVCRSKA